MSFPSFCRTVPFLIAGWQLAAATPSPLAAPPEPKLPPPQAIAGPGQELQGILDGAVSALKTRIETGPPFLREERRARTERLERLLADANADPGEKYRRVLEAYRVELDYAKTVEAYRGVLRIGQDERLVDFLSIGRLALYYQTLDGHESGVWRSGQWQRLSGEENEAISQGLRTARKLDPPQLIVLPLPGPQ